MAITERGRFSFRVSEYESGQPWITTDPLNDSDVLKTLGPQGFVGFDLKPGTSYEEAQRIAKYLDQQIEFITITTP